MAGSSARGVERALRHDDRTAAAGTHRGQPRIEEEHPYRWIVLPLLRAVVADGRGAGLSAGWTSRARTAPCWSHPSTSTVCACTIAYIPMPISREISHEDEFPLT